MRLTRYLELPLSWHDFCISARNVNASIETCAIVSLQYITTKHSISSDTAVVRPCQHSINTSQFSSYSQLLHYTIQCNSVQVSPSVSGITSDFAGKRNDESQFKQKTVVIAPAILAHYTRDVNETLAYETETRPRHSVFGPRRDRDQDLPAIPRD